MELPPGARRIRGLMGLEAANPGTTSACAENTSDGKTFPMIFWNYLRVRGEYPSGLITTVYFVELPPRARRIQVIVISGDSSPGTTSACAENTQPIGLTTHWRRNYLRVRGEYIGGGGLAGWGWELPPRARRILPHPIHGVLHSGTTSACAENTCQCDSGGL